MIYRCEVCGKEFKAKPSQRRRFCSHECCLKANEEQHFLGKRELKGVTKVCKVCGKEFYVAQNRAETAVCCSRECSDKAHIAEPNVVCTYCGKPFHMKRYRMIRYQRREGFFCSNECFNKHKAIWFVGENNHQYGLKGPLNDTFGGGNITHKNHNLLETLVYAPEHPRADFRGRVVKHHIVVEENADLFPQECFEIINGKRYLNTKKYVVHHIDGNHDNHELSNLMVMTRGEHSRYHNTKVK